MARHASMGASNSARWIACPGSVKASEGRSGGTSSAAEAGTLAHWVAELAVRTGKVPEYLLGATIVGMEDGGKVDREMLDGATMYLATARSLGAGMLRLEQSLEFPDEPELFGTTDLCHIVPGGTLTVLDYKFGRRLVEPRENSQGMFYGLCALSEYGKAFGVSALKVGIVQPRPYHPEGKVRWWEPTAADVARWRKTFAKAIKAARADAAPLHAGEHCTFCPAQPMCPEHQEHLSERGLVFQPEAKELEVPEDAEQLARVIEAIPMVKAFMKACEDEAQRRIESGEPAPGLKLVRGTSRRRWRSEASAVQELKELVDLKDITKTGLVSPAQVEKALTKAKVKPKERKLILDRLAETPLGALNVVPESDPREPASLAVDVLAEGLLE